MKSNQERQNIWRLLEQGRKEVNRLENDLREYEQQGMQNSFFYKDTKQQLLSTYELIAQLNIELRKVA